MSRIIKGIFGGTSESEKILQRFQPTGFTTPGLSGTFANDRFTLRRGGEAGDAISDVGALSQEQASAFRGLRDRVRPGFGELTRTRIDAIRGAGKRAVGNLREELGKRRVLGSTFASREIASEEARFGQLEEQSRAESFLQEVALTSQLIQQEFSASITGVLEILKQLNFETAIGAQLSANTSRLINDNLTSQAEAQSAQQAAGEDFLGTLMALIFG